MADLEVPMKAEEALRSMMKADALKKCRDFCKDYAECSRDRTVSVIWACSDQFSALNSCLKTHTTKEVLEDYKKKWVADGRPYQYVDKAPEKPPK
mmetsp:Transcript_10192/g.21255  ORF Transcript_10192/g.21255 Transcript_10192/m.21255 type:complete len:95 (+) Transcript_10192:137-421(+)|eukprot:CAMPEP_0118925358 /NCGR_PEP_ID=MMETSP1169-20130426/3250_1 /TAXON_ID=36882 /ORGANISM="Pyramimonas obovata, Strain CCMP722" /LENGTH=94 /DNA_ID=CAMNT_0006866621 /DNA_START=93 /DNA_END=377 /DNA_ORIENTATION=-